MKESIRGKAAIAGIGELKPERIRTDRNTMSLLAEACYLAVKDAGIRKQEIDCIIMEPEYGGIHSGFNAKMAEYMGLQPTWSTGCELLGASSVVALGQAAAYISAGLARVVLVGTAQPVDPNARPPVIAHQESATSEFSDPYGPAAAANGWYGMIAKRHESLYGSTVQQRAKIAVDQRFNANHNPKAWFHGTPITIDDVVNSRMVADPLRLLECVMWCSGAAAYVVTSADMARSLRQKPAFILGCGMWLPRSNLTHVGEITIAPIKGASQKAFAMAGYGPRDMDVLELYDSYTITVMCELEDSGFCNKGEGGEFVQAHDLTFKGDTPLNTHGGQISYGQAGDAGGFSQVIEAVTQIRGDGGEHQVRHRDVELVYVTGSAGTYSAQSAAVLASDVTD